jgi:predicted Zn-dependent protease
MNDSMIRARWARTLVLVAALAGAVQPMALHAQLPAMGDGGDLSLGAERRLGDRIARELFRDPDYLDDPVLADYVQGLWQRLLAAARQRGDLNAELDQRFAWQVLLGKDRSINAFALPGGWLGMNLGLLAVSSSGDEVASVLAHELSHVTQRHISRLMTQEERQTPWLVGAMILGVLAASKNPQAASAVITGGQAVAARNQLTFSRDMEREADRVGFGVLTQAGFAPQAFASMFDKLQHASRLNDNGAFPYLRTHPLTTERAADMQSRQALVERGAAPASGDLEHALMAARARALSAGGVDALRTLQRDADGLPAQADATRRAAAWYGAALASARLREMPAALRYAQRLASLQAADSQAGRAVRLLAAELALMAGDAARAASLLPLGSGSRAEMLLSAQAALQTGRAGEAMQSLQVWVTTRAQDAAAWQLLGRAAAAQGQTLRAVRAEAEAQMATLDYSAAMDRLRAAQELARKGNVDHIEASIIDTRARQVQALLREQALER